MAKNTICLWYDHEAEAAARFYAATFPQQQRRRGPPCARPTIPTAKRAMP